jgi:hypothetical protein
MDHEMTQVRPERLNWFSAIGMFILNFGMLEKLVTEYLETKLSSDAFEKVREGPFHERLLEMESLVANNDLLKHEFADFQLQLNPIRTLRNHIAHGYLQLDLTRGEQEHVVAIIQSKDTGVTQDGTTKYVTFASLMENHNSLTQVIETFVQTFVIN